MKTFVWALALVTGALGVNAAYAQEMVALSASHPYAYATAAEQKNGAVFMELINAGDVDVTITGVHTDVAEKAELHTMEMEGDVMQMRPVDSFTVLPAEPLTLSPHAGHIMLMDLNAPLTIGQDIEVVLETTQGDLPVHVLVLAPGTNIKDHTFHDEKDAHAPVVPVAPAEAE